MKDFGSVIAVMNAPTTDLMKTDKLGEKKAKDIQTVLAAKYDEL